MKVYLDLAATVVFGDGATFQHILELACPFWGNDGSQISNESCVSMLHTSRSGMKICTCTDKHYAKTYDSMKYYSILHFSTQEFCKDKFEHETGTQH